MRGGGAVPRLPRWVETCLLTAGALMAIPAAGSAQTLERAAAAVAEAWMDPSLSALEGLLDPMGSLFAVDGREHSHLTPSRVAAAVADLRRDQVSGNVRVIRAVDVGGDPSRAFVELAWDSIETGTSEPSERRVYFGLVEREARFWITEIRIFP